MEGLIDCKDHPFQEVSIHTEVLRLIGSYLNSQPDEGYVCPLSDKEILGKFFLFPHFKVRLSSPLLISSTQRSKQKSKKIVLYRVSRPGTLVLQEKTITLFMAKVGFSQHRRFPMGSLVVITLRMPTNLVLFPPPVNCTC